MDTASVATKVALGCPRCGGAPEPAAGPGLLARCGSCGVLGRIDDGEGLRRLALLPSIDEGFARQAATEGLDEAGHAKARAYGVELLFVPYWRVRTVLAGFLTGQRRRTRRVLEKITLENGGSHYQWEERDDGTEEVKKEVQKHVMTLIAACPLEELGLPTLDSQRQDPGALGVGRPLGRAGKAVVFDESLHERGQVLDPLVSKARAEAEAELLLDRHREGLKAGLERGATLDSAALDREIHLLYYPVYLVRVGLRAARGSVAVDGCTGRVVSLRWPGGSPETAQDRRVLAFAGAASGFVAASLLRLALLPPALIADPGSSSLRWRIAAAALLLGGAAWAGLRKLAAVLGERR